MTKPDSNNGVSQAIVLLCSLSALMLGLITSNLLLLIAILLAVFGSILVKLFASNHKGQVKIDKQDSLKLKNLTFFVGAASVISGIASIFVRSSSTLFNNIYIFLTIWLFLAGVQGFLSLVNKSASRRADIGIAIAFIGWSVFYVIYELVDDGIGKQVFQVLACIIMLAGIIVTASSDFNNNSNTSVTLD